MAKQTICPHSEFGGGPFGENGWVCQHYEVKWGGPKQFIIDLPTERWRTDDGSEHGCGLKELSKRVCGATPENSPAKRKHPP